MQSQEGYGGGRKAHTFQQGATWSPGALLCTQGRQGSEKSGGKEVHTHRRGKEGQGERLLAQALRLIASIGWCIHTKDKRHSVC